MFFLILCDAAFAAILSLSFFIRMNKVHWHKLLFIQHLAKHSNKAVTKTKTILKIFTSLHKRVGSWDTGKEDGFYPGLLYINHKTKKTSTLQLDGQQT